MPTVNSGGVGSIVKSATGTLQLADMEQWATVGVQLLADPGRGKTIAVPVMGFLNFYLGAHGPSVGQATDIFVVSDAGLSSANVLTFPSATVGTLDSDTLAWISSGPAALTENQTFGGGLFVYAATDITGFTVAGSNPTLNVTILYVVRDAPLQ